MNTSRYRAQNETPRLKQPQVSGTATRDHAIQRHAGVDPVADRDVGDRVEVGQAGVGVFTIRVSVMASGGVPPKLTVCKTAAGIVAGLPTGPRPAENGTGSSVLPGRSVTAAQVKLSSRLRRRRTRPTDGSQADGRSC